VKLVFVCSGKGGAGKSCVCAYTAAAMAKTGKKTLLIDMGGVPGSLDLILGAQDYAVFNLGDVLKGDCEPEKAIVAVEGYKDLFLLPAGIPPRGKADKNSLDKVIEQVKDEYEFVFLDNPDFDALKPQPDDTILLVTTPDTLSVRAAAQKNLELFEAGIQGVRLVINHVPARVIPMNSFHSFDDIIDTVAAQLIAVIPSSQKLHHSANNGLPLSRESLTVKIFERAAGRLLNKPLPLLVR